ncbi:MAG: D-2-hydroxyacid dehydrogenase [Anaerolineae bacterium]|nr:D-2-hydroxyacid dehydrogenase [Anaerolineae bacterium]
MNTIHILSLQDLASEYLDKLRAVSPQLEVHQVNADDLGPSRHEPMLLEAIPQTIRDQTEILFGWGKCMGQTALFPRLKWLQTHSAGIDYLFDMPVWSRDDILISNARGVHAVPMAEYALAMMLALTRDIPLMLKLQAQAEWPAERWATFARPELRGQTLGLIGYGAISRELARQAQALGLRVLACNNSGQRSTYQGYHIPGTGDAQATIPETIYPTERLLDMLPGCDFVVMLAPLTADTRHMINASAFAAMKESAIFINLARGALVDELALVSALSNGQIAAAGLDVFAKEPLPADSPLWALDNVIISPHVSGFTPHYDARSTDIFAENLRRYLNGEPLLNHVKRGKSY